MSPEHPGNDTQRVLCSRRTVHEYLPEPVSEATIKDAIEAAGAAPNHRMTEPWRFVSVQGEAREALLARAMQLKEAKAGAPLSEAQTKALREKMLNPALLFVVTRVRHPRPDVEREDYAAVACAVQNLMLSFWSNGVGSKWSTGEITTDPFTYQRLGVSEAEQEIVGFVWAGVPASSASKPARRTPPSELWRIVD